MLLVAAAWPALDSGLIDLVSLLAMFPVHAPAWKLEGIHLDDGRPLALEYTRERG